VQPAHPHTTSPPRYPAIGLQGRVADALDALCRPDADGFAESVPPDDGDRWSWSAIVRMVTDRLGPYAGADADSVYGPVARYVMAETASDWVTVGYGPMTRHALIVAEQAGVTARCVAPYAVTLWLSDAVHARTIRQAVSALELDVAERSGNSVVMLDGSVRTYPAGEPPAWAIASPELCRHDDCALCTERLKHWHEYSLT
jgi:hypothetical protein